MVTLEQIAEFMGGHLLAEVGGDPEKVDALVKRKLGEFGFDPEGVARMGQTIINLAISQGEEPEATIMACWQMGVVLGAALGERP